MLPAGLGQAPGRSQRARPDGRRSGVGRCTPSSAPWSSSANRRVKSSPAARQPGVKVVAGGPLFTIEPEQYRRRGRPFRPERAELTLPPFLTDLDAGLPAARLHPTDFADLQQTPVPLWELLDLKRYAMMSIQFSRGCPFNCDFCNVTALLGHRPRTKTAAQIIAELDGLYALGWRSSVFFVDDNFIGNKRQLKTELLPALIEWRQDKPGITFHTEASINLADDEELMELMASAGFTWSSSASKPPTKPAWPSAARSRTSSATWSKT